MKNKIIIGTRASRLALWQANHIAERLKSEHDGLSVELKTMTTKGDRILDVPLAKIGGKGLFTKELETKILEGEIDLAVHSLKDMPTDLPEGLILAALTSRAEVRDAFVSEKYNCLLELPKGACVGPSSLRRKAQLLNLRPDLKIEDLRGNLDTRLKKLQGGEYDAIILAAAGLTRLGLEGAIKELLPTDKLIPAVGQGILAIEARDGDKETLSLLKCLNDEESALAAKAERAFLARVEGGCQVPVGVHATVKGKEITIQALIASLDGKEFYTGEKKGKRENCAILGKELAEELLNAGGRKILNEIGLLTEEIIMKGKVFLVGAGPGDYELLTLKAKRLLENAQTVVYDHLADERILGFAPKDAEYIYVGKEAGNHAMKQPDINQLLVDKAKEGKLVVRLKGGDPFVFGRGGEEALLLRENGLPFEVVPGVTSAIAVAAYAGIPVTHRGVAVSFAVITGHEGAGKETSDVNWEKLATAADTLVFLMSASNISEIADKLMKNGRAGDTPVAFIRWGTKLEQSVTVTTLKNAGETAKTTNLKPPAIFLVGEVVKLRESLKWFDEEKMRPLFGKTVLVTRARPQASALTEKLERLGARVLELPTIKITEPKDNYASLDKAIESIEDYSWLIFTSTNGAEHFFSRMKKARKDSRSLSGAKIVAIGSATKEKLEQYGIIADIVPEKYIAEGILSSLKEKVKAGDKILLARAKEARQTLPEGLKELGADVNIVTAYETEASGENANEAKKMLQAGEIDYITFTSSSTVDNFIAAVGKEFKGARLIAIGPVTCETIKKHGLTPFSVADVYTLDGVIDEIIKAEKSNQK